MRARRFLLVGVLAGAIAAAACRGDDDKGSGGGKAKRAAATRRVDPATAGVIEGTVSFPGAAPANPELSIGEPACAKVHDGPVHEDVVLVKDGKLENAFVYIKEGLADYAFDPPSAEVTIDQVGCVYRPLVVGVQVGQPLTFINSDSVLHNVHTLPEENRGANFSMPSKDMRTSKKFSEPEVMIRTKCDVHPWMRAFIGVVAHPHFAVTGADGNFRFEGVPPGDHVVEMWHEKLGRQTQKVTVADKATVRADFAAK
jgi:plastocyanin